MDINDKISFDIVSIYDGNGVRSLDLKVTEKNGNVTFVDSYGGLHHRDLQRGESPFSYNVDNQESYINKKGEKAVRMFKRIEYWPEQFEGQLEGNERTLNIIARHAHTLVKKHPSVIIRDANKGNSNPNQHGLVLFELRETTQIIKDKVQKNIEVSKAQAIATELMQEDPESFIDLCYRYSIQPVKEVPIETLYNEVMLKIANNPTHFMEILNHKDAVFLTLVKRAMIGTELDPAIISFEDPFYFMNGENLGQKEEEIIYNLSKSARNREFLMMSLGVPIEDEVEVVVLPSTSDAIEASKPSQDYQRRTDKSRIEEARKAMNSITVQWEKEKKKNPAGGSVLDDKFKAQLSKKRELYLDVADFWDAELAYKLPYITKD